MLDGSTRDLQKPGTIASSIWNKIAYMEASLLKVTQYQMSILSQSLCN